jgi:hypothetical protein
MNIYVVIMSIVGPKKPTQLTFALYPTWPNPLYTKIHLYHPNTHCATIYIHRQVVV